MKSLVLKIKSWVDKNFNSDEKCETYTFDIENQNPALNFSSNTNKTNTPDVYEAENERLKKLATSIKKENEKLYVIITTVKKENELLSKRVSQYNENTIAQIDLMYEILIQDLEKRNKKVYKPYLKRL